MPKDHQLWATADAAKALQVSRRHVRRLASAGQLSLFAVTPSGQMLFEPTAVVQFQRRRGAQAWHARAHEYRMTPAMAARALARASLVEKVMAKAKIEQVRVGTSPRAIPNKTAEIA